FFLEFFVQFQIIVEAKHEQVVLGAAADFGPEQAQDALAQMIQPARPGAIGQASRFAVAFEQLGEWIACHPDSRFARLEVGEDAENAIAPRWRQGEGIDVQQIVPRLGPETPRRFFLWAKTGAIQLPTLTVLRQQLSQPARRRFREPREDAP